jgi:hypothetical protein
VHRSSVLLTPSLIGGDRRGFAFGATRVSIDPSASPRSPTRAATSPRERRARCEASIPDDSSGGQRVFGRHPSTYLFL